MQKDIDRLIRRHGYRGTPATLEQVRRQPELAAGYRLTCRSAL